ncbi:MAG: MaoC family dehydratase [Alphaproteobacteria bacterium]
MSLFGYLQLGPKRYRERFGLSFEDVTVGLRICHRPGIDVSQQDNRDESTDLINNAHLHYDSHYATQTEWKQPLGVSTMTVQRFFGMASRSWYRRRTLLGIQSIAMTGPVFGGDTLYSTSTVTAVEDAGNPDVGIVSLVIEGSNQRGEIVARIACRIEVYRRGRHPEDDPGAAPAREDRFRLHHTREDGSLVEQTGLVFEDLAEGETFVHWPGRTIGKEENELHALRSLEINPRWHDAAYRARHGMAEHVYEPLVVGAVTALTTRTFGRVVANLGWTDIELPRPVRVGETIYAESTIGQLRSSGSRPTQGIAQVDTRAFVGSGEIVCSYRRTLLLYRRGHGPYAAAGY